MDINKLKITDMKRLTLFIFSLIVALSVHSQSIFCTATFEQVSNIATFTNVRNYDPPRTIWLESDFNESIITKACLILKIEGPKTRRMCEEIANALVLKLGNAREGKDEYGNTRVYWQGKDFSLEITIYDQKALQLIFRKSDGWNKGAVSQSREKKFADKQEQKREEETIFSHVEVPPSFPGGEKEMVKWLSDNIKYPTIVTEQGIQGHVVIRVVIRSDGSITDIEVQRSLDPNCDKEAIRVVKKMPKWNPGEQNGNVVSVYYLLLINFGLQANKIVEE
jgi:TonB family protein